MGLFELSDDQDTICSLVTARGVSGVAIIRVSGNKSHQITKKLAPFLPDRPISHVAYFGVLKFDQSAIDEAIVLYFDHGKSFTGEMTCEIQCHGNPLIIEQILESLVSLGARQARPGEFTYRAFMNGRIDLVQAESVLSLIESQSGAVKNQSLRQLKGGLSEDLLALESSIIWCLAHIEASIDFSTENLEVVSKQVLLNKLSGELKRLDGLLRSYNIGKIQKNGFRVSIVGRPNVGKSSLFNFLIGEDRSIVSQKAGTTRDVVDYCISLNGIEFRFFDTAGIRNTEDEIEKEGIHRSRQTQISADLIFLVYDISTGFDAEDFEILSNLPLEKTFLIGNKSDLVENLSKNLLADQEKLTELLGKKTSFFNENIFKEKHFANSCKDQGARDALLSRIADMSLDYRFEDHSVLIHSRHYENLNKAREHINETISAVESGVAVELATLALRESLYFVHETLGKRYDDQVIDRIFKEFCLGK